MKKEQNGRKSLRRLKATVGCNASKRRKFTNKYVGTGPLSCEKRIYRAAVSQSFRNAALHRKNS